MKIGLFTDAYKPYVSGVVSSINILKSGLEELGHEVFVVTVKLPPFDFNLTEKNIIRFDGKKYPLKNFSNYRYITKKNKKLKELKKYNFDVIHIHTEFAIGQLGIKYAKKYKVPCVTTYHTNYEDYFHYLKTIVPNFIEKRILFKILKKTIKKLEAVSHTYIVPTTKIENVFRKYNFKFPVCVIPSGIDLDKFKKENQDNALVNNIKDKYNLHDKFVCTFIGRISEEKSLDIIIKAFSKIDKENVVLLICGYGPAFDSITNLTKDLNIEDKVIFTNSIAFDEISLYYNCSDLFVNASLTETQGLTFIEALASSVPLVIRNDEATKDVLQENVNGMYFETEEEFIQIVSKFIQDTEYYNFIKDNTVKSIENFSKKNYALSLEKLYKEIL